MVVEGPDLGTGEIETPFCVDYIFLIFSLCVTLLYLKWNFISILSIIDFLYRSSNKETIRLNAVDI